MARMRWAALAALALTLIVTPVAVADDSRDAWAALVSGSHVALVRLDDRGRAQGRALGEAFRQHGVRVEVRGSCR